MCVQTVYSVSVHPSTWYVLRVTARSAAGSTDCFLKFQTARHHKTATLVPHRVVVRYQPPFYERIEVVIPFCGIVVTVILIVVAVGVCWRWRRERRAERLAAKVGVVYRYDTTAIVSRAL